MAQAKTRARLEAKVAALVDRLAAAEQVQSKAVGDLDIVRAELAAEQRRAECAEAEAALARQLLAPLRVAPHECGGGRRRKAGSPAATEQGDQVEEQGEGPGEERNDEQGAPAQPGHPADGSDSSDDNDDSQH